VNGSPDLDVHRLASIVAGVLMTVMADVSPDTISVYTTPT
jgi:hypothetical protein